MILWPNSKRSVKDLSLAAEIAAAAREGGAEPVGVFVDESPEQARTRRQRSPTGSTRRALPAPPALARRAARLQHGRGRLRKQPMCVQPGSLSMRPQLKNRLRKQPARGLCRGAVLLWHALRVPPLRRTTQPPWRCTALRCRAVTALTWPQPHLQIVAACDAAGVTMAQLHGDAARLSLQGLPTRLKAVYVMTASPAGALLTPLPGARIEAKPDLMKGEQGWRKAIDWVSQGRRTVDWLLVDGQTPGSGEAYDWRALRVPRGVSRRGWLLAGGLTPENVGAAIAVAHPDGVDVASGVTKACGVLKDPARVEAFVAAVKEAAAAPPVPR